MVKRPGPEEIKNRYETLLEILSSDLRSLNSAAWVISVNIAIDDMITILKALRHDVSISA